MSHTGYIVDTAILPEIPPGVLWHAERIAGSAKSLVAIEWAGSENHGAAFEARPDVLHLGAPWEVMPAEAATLVAAMKTVATQVVMAPTTPDTVASALGRVDSAVARLIRWR